MIKQKRFLIIMISLLFLSVFILSSCNNKNTDTHEKSVDFPLDDKGYPQNNVVIINGNTYSIDLKNNSNENSKTKTKIELNLSDDKKDIEIILPQYLPINSWFFDEKNYINLKTYEKLEYPIKKDNMIEGISPFVLKFNIEVSDSETTELVFKWANINEANKSFEDKNEDYLLKIAITQ